MSDDKKQLTVVMVTGLALDLTVQGDWDTPDLSSKVFVALDADNRKVYINCNHIVCWFFSEDK